MLHVYEIGKKDQGKKRISIVVNNLFIVYIIFFFVISLNLMTFRQTISIK